LAIATRVGAVHQPISIVIELVPAELHLAVAGWVLEAIRVEAIDLGVPVVVLLVVAHLGVVHRWGGGAAAGTQPCQRDGEDKT
jgi:hypothetical protein